MKRNHILLFGAITLWFFVNIIGCGKGKVTESPESPPVVDYTRITTFHATFSLERGEVLLEWSLSRRDNIEEIKIERKSETEDYEIIGRLVPEANAPEVMSFKDTSPLSAENYTYRIAVVSLGNHLQFSKAVDVSIPGANFIDALSNHSTATVELIWEVDNDVASVEVIKKSSLGEERIFRSTTSGKNTFVDENIMGNTLYTYFLRTIMENGVSLNSRGLLSGIYLETDVQQLRGISETTRIATDMESTYPDKPLVKTQNNNEFSLTRFVSGVGHIWVQQEPLILTLDGYRIASISTDGPTSFHSRPLFLLSAIQASTSTLEVSVFAYKVVDRKPVLEPVDIPVKPWEVSPNAQQTLITLGLSGNIYVFGDNRIKAYDKVYQEQGTFDAERPGNPYDLLAVNYTLWMSYPDEEALVFGRTDAHAQNITWSQIEFEKPRRPTGLTMNVHKQICVLDAQNKEVLVFDQNGQLVVTIGNIAGEFYSQGMWGGDIDAADYNTINGIYVLDLTGRLTLLETPPNYRLRAGQ